MKIKNGRGSIELLSNWPCAAFSLLRGTRWLLSIVFVFACYNAAQAQIIAGSTNSTIQISSGAAMHNQDPSLAVDLGGGTLLIGDNAIAANRSFRAPAPKIPTVKGGKLVLEFPKGSPIKTLAGNSTVFNAIFPSGSEFVTTVKSGLLSTLKGQIASGSSNAYIDLDGQTTTFTGAVTFSTGAFPYGGGINFNGQRLTLNGPTVVESDSDLLLIGANDIAFTNNISLNTAWTFENDGVVNGNGGVLDLSGGGILAIHPFTSLSLHNFVLRGVENGSIVLFDKTSEIRLSNMIIELSNDYTVTTGGFYVDGPTTIVTADKAFTLANAGSMTVDHVSLLYDTLSFPDQQNIAPALGTDIHHKNVIALNNGVIRSVNAPTQGSVHITADTTLGGATLVHPNRKLLFDNSATLDGNTFPIVFSNAAEPLITVAAGQSATIKNARLEFFSPSYLSIGAGASLNFDNATEMNFGSDQDLNMTMTFKKSCVISGNNHTLNLGAHGGLMISGHKASLLLENMVITGLDGTKINCTDNTCTLTLSNVRFVLDGSYVFPTTQVEVLRMLEGDADVASSQCAAGAQKHDQYIIKGGQELVPGTGILFNRRV